MNSILINLSGHLLNSQARQELENIHDLVIDAKPIEIEFNGNIEEQIIQYVKKIPIVIDGSSAITIIPPGQSTFAIMLVSYLHGLIGHFPNICYLERAASGIYIPKIEYKISPQDIRVAGRRIRNLQSDV